MNRKKRHLLTPTDGDKKLKKAKPCDLVSPIFHRMHEDLKDANKRLKTILEIQVERNK